MGVVVATPDVKGGVMKTIEELNRAMHSFNCTKCKFRTNPTTTNKGPFCEIGFTQNPRTVEATKNLIANGGSPCFRNPIKYEEGIRA